jgi:hypothetical protein
MREFQLDRICTKHVVNILSLIFLSIQRLSERDRSLAIRLLYIFCYVICVIYFIVVLWCVKVCVSGGVRDSAKE